jgi:hypothetical protein
MRGVRLFNDGMYFMNRPSSSTVTPILLLLLVTLLTLLPISTSTSGANICQTHKVILQTGFANVVYGRLVYYEELEEARKNAFPNANTWVSGGCIVEWSPFGVGNAKKTLFCSKCRQAEAVWLKEHGMEGLYR